MPITTTPHHLYEPTPLQCGQAVLAMLADVTVEQVIAVVGTDRETTRKDMFVALERFGIGYDPVRHQAWEKGDLPSVCILSLETPKCWHWSLYFHGRFYDPEYGVSEEFPPSARRYYFTVTETIPYQQEEM